MAETRVGIAGWTYPPWRGTFYPKDLPQKRELEFASRALNSIELNGSFYSLQKPSSYRTWYQQTPEGFVFSLKGGQFITHMRRLKDVREPLANFLASGVLALNEKLGPILWQFPANFAYDAERFETFFALLPRDTKSAVALAKEHTPKLAGRTWTETDKSRPMRFAVEIRHPSFMVPEFMRMLQKYNVAFVFGDSQGKWPYADDVTADFIYARLHGDEALYANGYTDDALDRWASRFKEWRAGKQPRDAKCLLDRSHSSNKPRDVYVYFDDEVKVKSPTDAIGLSRRLGVEWGPDQPKSSKPRVTEVTKRRSPAKRTKPSN
jgi:uncharacterized protein YecE (DUF72 family)